MSDTEPEEKFDPSDPLQILDLLSKAITRKTVDKHQVADALKQVMSNYEQQNRVFLIATANAEIPRIVRLLTFITNVEHEMFDSKRLESMSDKDLLRAYALAQAHMLHSVDSVKQVADMRLEAIQKTGGMQGAGDLFSISSESDLKDIAGLPGLDAPSRDKIRRLVGGIVDSIAKDRTVQEDNELPSSDRDSKG